MTTQLRMLDPAPRRTTSRTTTRKPVQRMDKRTREIGLKGVAQAREALRRATAQTAA